MRWGAVLPLSIECHPLAQATLLTNIGDWRWPVPLITRKLGGVYPRQSLDLGVEPPVYLLQIIARVKGGLYAHHWARLSRPNRS